MLKSTPKYFKADSAIVESDEIGEGTEIWHFSHVRKGAKLGNNCRLGNNVYIDRDVIVRNNVKIQNNVSIYKGITIEDDVFIGPSVVFTNDLYPRSFIWSADMIIPSVIKRGASIGANSTIICGVELGEFSMVGAGSLVCKDVQPYTLVYGAPAIKRRSIGFCGKKLLDSCIIESNESGIKLNCGNCSEVIFVDGHVS